jgi:hypothetical protein
VNTERKTLDFHYYKIIAGKAGDQYRAVGWPKLKELVKVEATSATFEDTLVAVRQAAIQQEREFVQALYQALRTKMQENPHFIAKLEHAQSNRVISARDTHCHRCRLSLFGTSALSCPSCNWLMCPKCGSCNCNYSGPIQKAK